MASCFWLTKDRQSLIQIYAAYKIPCLCDKRDISQTGHSIPTRLSERIRNTRLENQQSAVAKHSTEKKHSTDFDRREIVANIQTYHPCIIKETTEITAPQF
jgi:hypothetical protein